MTPLHVSNVGHRHARDYRVQVHSSDVQPNRVESPDVVGTTNSIMQEAK